MKQIALIILVGLISHTVHAVSFDCADAQSKVEHLICDNPTLSRLDNELSDAYESALDIDENNDLLRREQKDWLANKRNSCGEAPCLERTYNDRIQTLTALAHATSQPRSQIIFSTYLGGKGDDRANKIRVDRAGNTYIGGSTEAWDDFPVLNAIQNKRKGSKGGIVAKFSREGSLLWATHLGGARSNFQYSNYEAYNLVTGVALDAESNLYVVGDTDAVDFPTLNAAQPELRGSRSSFLAKFNGTGQLIWSTYIGELYIRDIATDHDGAAYLAAIKMRPNKGGVSVIAKYDSTGKYLWEKEFGGIEHNTDARSIAIDGMGNVYIGGDAQIDTLPNQIGDANYAKGYWNPFVAKFGKDGELLWSTKLGGEDRDSLAGIDTDQSGNVYVTGNTKSKEYPTLNAAQSIRPGKEDAFVAKFSPAGKLLWSTYLGSTGNDSASAIVVDVNGYIHVTGSTASTSFPTKRSFQRRKAGLINAFVTTYSSDGKIVRSSYLGGSGNTGKTGTLFGVNSDIGFSITADHDANVYVTGFAASSDFPLKNPYQAVSGGLYDIFVTNISALK